MCRSVRGRLIGLRLASGVLNSSSAKDRIRPEPQRSTACSSRNILWMPTSTIKRSGSGNLGLVAYRNCSWFHRFPSLTQPGAAACPSLVSILGFENARVVSNRRARREMNSPPSSPHEAVTGFFRLGCAPWARHLQTPCCIRSVTF